MAALLLEFQGPQQAPLAGTQAPGAGAGKVALASWVLASSNLQARPLWCSSSSAGWCPPGPALEAQDGASAHCPVVSLGPGFPGASISHPQLGQRSERWDGGREGRASLRGSCCSLRTSGPRPGLPGWPPTPDSDHTPQEAPAVSGGAADGPPPPPHLCPPSCVPAVVLSLLGASELHSEASSLDTGSGRVGQIAERATGHGFTPRPTPEAGPAPPLRLTPPHPQYGIVLDAGSSHTAMFIYKWPADKENDTGIVGQHSSCDVRGGGISSYADNPSGAGQSLVECLNQALRDVPEERHASTPLYLGATAGMRLLNLTSPEASASVLAAVTQTLTQYPFDFRGARILSGQDEGVFGWVTANYLLENFIKYGWVGRWFRPRKGTLGAMDLGGASTQITFETASPAEDPASEVQLRLYGQRYRVYTHSFLCYGRDQVLRRLLASALQTHGSHPCWPQGYSTHVMLQEVFESPCTAAQRPRAFNGSTRVSLAGSSDPTLCRGLVSQLFNASSCRFSRCSFSGVFQPPVAGKFIAFSAFFYTMDFLRTVMGLPVATLQQLEVAVVTVCNQTWSELQARAPDHRARLPDYCAGAMFVQQLLSRGYGFDERSFGGVTFQKKAGDTAVGWALGYMLNLTNLIPADPPGLRKGTDFSSWVVLLLLFAAMLLAAFALLLHQARTTKLARTI